MTSNELREKFLSFFEKKEHKIVPSFSLIPFDKTVLFTTAGMQQFSLFLSGEKDTLKTFKNRHLTSCQKCFRTGDIDEVGDDTHCTFFEMLGNWSIGEDKETGYFKEKAITYALEFLLDELHINKDRLWMTCFKGNKDIPKDEETKNIWIKHGISEDRIKYFGKEDNLWGPVGSKGLCGPCSEIFYDRGKEFGCEKENCGINCPNCKRFVELWNLVFMGYFKNKEGGYELLSQRNVDTGMGFERVLSVLNKVSSPYETDLFSSMIKELENLSGEKYKDNLKDFRIISDHIRGSVFLIAEGILPSNLGRGYVLRKILRRSIGRAKLLELSSDWYISLVKQVLNVYKSQYPKLKTQKEKILITIKEEKEKFEKGLEKGLSIFEKIIDSKDKNEIFKGDEIFNIYQSHGLPLEVIKQLAFKKGFKIDEQGFYEAEKKHQEISRAGAEKKFGGFGKNADSKTVKLHTATHLLHSALRLVLGENVKQMGSDIDSQRLRFDFSYSKKMTSEEIKKVEDLINEKIKQDLIIKKEVMAYEKAIELGALAFFKEKYPEEVNVYSIGAFSKEVCAGPHIKKTSELGEFKIIKEKSSGSGIRRIKAILIDK